MRQLWSYHIGYKPSMIFEHATTYYTGYLASDKNYFVKQFSDFVDWIDGGEADVGVAFVRLHIDQVAGDDPAVRHLSLELAKRLLISKQMSSVNIFCVILASTRYVDFFKWAIPGLFLFYVRLFKQPLQFLQK